MTYLYWGFFVLTKFGFIRSYTADERIKRYEMAVAMAILGVRYTLEQLSEGFISEKGSGDVIDQVVKKPAFLKLTKNPNPTVSFSASLPYNNL